MIWTNINTDGTVNTQGAASSTSTTSSTAGTSTASDNNTLNVDDFLTLLVTQMQYQDPLEPTDNTQYIAQMATFTQVQATTEMQSKVEEQTASNLVGKTVIMKTDLNTDGYIAGKVDYWERIEGKIYLGIDGKLYDFNDLDTVMDDDYYKQYSAENDATSTI